MLFDQTSFAKFELVGADAEAALGRIAANDVAVPVGRLVYTQMLNDRGGIEADLTAARTADDAYYLVTGTGFATRDFDWIRRGIPRGLDAELLDVTASHSVLSLMGPRARDVLQGVTEAPLDREAFPFGTVREIRVAGCPVRALRITYVGELGWELHLPLEHAPAVYEALHAAGARHGLRNAGYRAIETLRLEKGYRAWGADIGPDHTPDEAGLGWAVKLDRDIDFRGRAAVEKQREDGVAKRLTTFTAAPEVILSGRETIYRNGVRVGWLSSAGYGHTIARSIGMGYVRDPDGVDATWIRAGRYELEVATERVPCEATLEPLYDPVMERARS